MNAFNRNISLTSIEYCGTLTGFPIVPICPPDRLAVIEKAAGEKAAAEKAAAEKAAAEKAAADLILKVEVDVWCENTYIGNPINCNSSFSIKGRDFSKAIKSGLFEVFTRVEGQKNWNFNTKFKVTVKPYSTSSYSLIPDELRVETKFNLKNLKMGAKPLLVMYKFTTDTKYSGTDRILPQTSVKIIAPGSVYVGETFNVKILTSKLFNGKCSIGNANTSISNGVGYLKLRTTNIGSITLRAYCESKNWILTGATWKMYSRE